VPRRLAEEVLAAVEAGRGTARDLLDRALALRPLDPRDRDLAREVAYGTLRRLLTLDHLLGALSRPRLRTLEPGVRAALRAGAYQVLFLDRVPAAAAVDEAVAGARRAAGGRAAGYANAVLRNLARTVAGRGEGDGDGDPRRSVPGGDGRHALLSRPLLPDPARDGAASLSVRWSMPRWIVMRWRESLGEERALAALRASAARPGTWLRPLPGRETALREALGAGGVPFEEEGDPPAFLLRGAGAVERLPGYAEGRFVVQDPSASRAVALLAPRPGERVLEIGAGRGGKTAFLAALVAPGGRVTSVDRDGARLALLRENLRRTGADPGTVEILQSDPLAGGPLPAGPFDRVLVDAPCTNTGVLARRVEARHRLVPRDVETLAAVGRRLLEAGLGLLRPGGVAVHSVCSLEPEEGPETARRALRSRGDCVLEAGELLLPVPGRRDGGWCGVIRRAPAPPFAAPPGGPV
jgi:16S rRNA (cytosine967-C5)-methyltransferase